MLPIKIKQLIYFPLIVFCIYTIHFFTFKYFKIVINRTVLNLDLNDLYLIFSLFSFIIITILLFIKQKNIDLVGNVFLLITCIKAIVCYIIIRPLTVVSINYSTEKFNFLGMFLFFLILETIATIKILNSK